MLDISAFMPVVEILVYVAVFCVLAMGAVKILTPKPKPTTKPENRYLTVDEELVSFAIVSADKPNVTHSTDGSYLRENQYRLYDLDHKGDHLILELLTHEGSFKCLVMVEEDNLNFISEAVAWWECSKLSTPSPIVIVNIKQ